ncbi:hypothetical protein CBI38_25875 [Rhodococcus oxybenzonivorans]|uniref:Uncharacterized protein n=1 Tax=Rhodococcus oxybenzonivorans TaxID=1990687 RepID=A0A2S2C0S9_9NOCA|nr:hypothetical protein CBI38_25875 [Rhodococcus oxybenzonivorans]
MWAPHGDPISEKILEHFGMTTRRFIERFCRVTPASNYASADLCALASGYPPPPGPPTPCPIQYAIERICYRPPL